MKLRDLIRKTKHFKSPTDLEREICLKFPFITEIPKDDSDLAKAFEEYKASFEELSPILKEFESKPEQDIKGCNYLIKKLECAYAFVLLHIIKKQGSPVSFSSFNPDTVTFLLDKDLLADEFNNFIKNSYLSLINLANLPIAFDESGKLENDDLNKALEKATGLTDIGFNKEGLCEGFLKDYGRGTGFIANYPFDAKAERADNELNEILDKFANSYLEDCWGKNFVNIIPLDKKKEIIQRIKILCSAIFHQGGLSYFSSCWGLWNITGAKVVPIAQRGLNIEFSADSKLISRLSYSTETKEIIFTGYFHAENNVRLNDRQFLPLEVPTHAIYGSELRVKNSFNDNYLAHFDLSKLNYDIALIDVSPQMYAWSSSFFKNNNILPPQYIDYLQPYIKGIAVFLNTDFDELIKLKLPLNHEILFSTYGSTYNFEEVKKGELNEIDCEKDFECVKLMLRSCYDDNSSDKYLILAKRLIAYTMLRWDKLALVSQKRFKNSLLNIANQIIFQAEIEARNNGKAVNLSLIPLEYKNWLNDCLNSTDKFPSMIPSAKEALTDNFKFDAICFHHVFDFIYPNLQNDFLLNFLKESIMDQNQSTFSRFTDISQADILPFSYPFDFNNAISKINTFINYQIKSNPNFHLNNLLARNIYLNDLKVISIIIEDLYSSAFTEDTIKNFNKRLIAYCAARWPALNPGEKQRFKVLLEIAFSGKLPNIFENCCEIDKLPLNEGMVEISELINDLAFNRSVLGSALSANQEFYDAYLKYKNSKPSVENTTSANNNANSVKPKEQSSTSSTFSNLVRKLGFSKSPEPTVIEEKKLSELKITIPDDKKFSEQEEFALLSHHFTKGIEEPIIQKYVAPLFPELMTKDISNLSSEQQEEIINKKFDFIIQALVDYTESFNCIILPIRDIEKFLKQLFLQGFFAQIESVDHTKKNEFAKKIIERLLKTHATDYGTAFCRKQNIELLQQCLPTIFEEIKNIMAEKKCIDLLKEIFDAGPKGASPSAKFSDVYLELIANQIEATISASATSSSADSNQKISVEEKREMIKILEMHKKDWQQASLEKNSHIIYERFLRISQQLSAFLPTPATKQSIFKRPVIKPLSGTAPISSASALPPKTAQAIASSPIFKAPISNPPTSTASQSVNPSSGDQPPSSMKP